MGNEEFWRGTNVEIAQKCIFDLVLCGQLRSDSEHFETVILTQTVLTPFWTIF